MAAYSKSCPLRVRGRRIKSGGDEDEIYFDSIDSMFHGITNADVTSINSVAG